MTIAAMPPVPPAPTERYPEMDALRSIALGLLIAYHVLLCYVPFGVDWGFLQAPEGLDRYWVIAEALNIWRIPILFVIGGLAMGYVLRRRDLRAVCEDRMMRLVPPLVFCSFLVSPLFPLIGALAQGEGYRYLPTPAHLWFVQGLVFFVVLALPMAAALRRWPEGALIRGLHGLLPWGLPLVFALLLMAETWLTRPEVFVYFPQRPLYGFACFALGLFCAGLGAPFSAAARRVAGAALAMALALYLWRVGVPGLGGYPGDVLTALESALWMMAALGLASRLFRRSTPVVRYLNRAIFPVYIIHMVVLQGLAAVMFPLGLPPGASYVLHVVATLALCLAIYEGVLRRSPALHPLFGVATPPLAVPPGRAARIGRAVTLYLLTLPIVLVTGWAVLGDLLP